jgi:hypothetical protein
VFAANMVEVQHYERAATLPIKPKKQNRINPIYHADNASCPNIDTTQPTQMEYMPQRCQGVDNHVLTHPYNKKRHPARVSTIIQCSIIIAHTTMIDRSK